MNGVGYGQPGDPMFTLQSGSRHGVAVPEVCATITKNYSTHHGRSAGNNGGIADGQMIPEISDTLNCPKGGSRTNQVDALNYIPEVAWALQERDSSDSSTKDGHLIPVAFSQHQDGAVRESDIVPTLSQNENASGRGNAKVRQQMRVRRLLPEECEILMGFPVGYTKIAYRGKPAEKCPDGPRYRSLGNSFPVNVVLWIGKRIQQLEDIKL